MNTLTIVILITAFTLIISGVFMLVKTTNVIRVVLAMELMMKAVILLIIFAGYINGNLVLAQAFVITLIVVEVIVAVVAAGIIVSLYKRTGRLDANKLDNISS